MCEALQVDFGEDDAMWTAKYDSQVNATMRKVSFEGRGGRPSLLNHAEVSTAAVELFKIVAYNLERLYHEHLNAIRHFQSSVPYKSPVPTWSMSRTKRDAIVASLPQSRAEFVRGAKDPWELLLFKFVVMARETGAVKKPSEEWDLLTRVVPRVTYVYDSYCAARAVRGLEVGFGGMGVGGDDDDDDDDDDHGGGGDKKNSNEANDEVVEEEGGNGKQPGGGGGGNDEVEAVDDMHSEESLQDRQKKLLGAYYTFQWIDSVWRDEETWAAIDLKMYHKDTVEEFRTTIVPRVLEKALKEHYTAINILRQLWGAEIGPSTDRLHGETRVAAIVTVITARLKKDLGNLTWSPVTAVQFGALDGSTPLEKEIMDTFDALVECLHTGGNEIEMARQWRFTFKRIRTERHRSDVSDEALYTSCVQILLFHHVKPPIDEDDRRMEALRWMWMRSTFKNESMQLFIESHLEKVESWTLKLKSHDEIDEFAKMHCGHIKTLIDTMNEGMPPCLDDPDVLTA